MSQKALPGAAAPLFFAQIHTIVSDDFSPVIMIGFVDLLCLSYWYSTDFYTPQTFQMHFLNIL